jgi:hypothetical protein
MNVLVDQRIDLYSHGAVRSTFVPQGYAHDLDVEYLKLRTSQVQDTPSNRVFEVHIHVFVN